MDFQTINHHGIPWKFHRAPIMNDIIPTAFFRRRMEIAGYYSIPEPERLSRLLMDIYHNCSIISRRIRDDHQVMIRLQINWSLFQWPLSRTIRPISEVCLTCIYNSSRQINGEWPAQRGAEEAGMAAYAPGPRYARRSHAPGIYPREKNLRNSLWLVPHSRASLGAVGLLDI